MSILPVSSPFDPDGEKWWLKGRTGLAKQLCDAGLFLRALRFQMRFGELTRAPLRIIRLQVGDNNAECEWLARPQDPWDAGLAREIGRRHASLQALKDAIDVRALIFEMLPQVETARLHAYRECSSHTPEMIITGNVRREDSRFRSVHSLAMRAKLFGFRFCLENSDLCRLSKDEQFSAGD
jgi:hypothetical protein